MLSIREKWATRRSSVDTEVYCVIAEYICESAKSTPREASTNFRTGLGMAGTEGREEYLRKYLVRSASAVSESAMETLRSLRDRDGGELMAAAAASAAA
jgi:hypothetical protein